MPFFYWNPMYWIIVGPAVLFMLYAQWRVKAAYNKWGQIPNSRRMPGVTAAEQLLSQQGLQGVRIQGVTGRLTDNYDPRSKTLNLSESTARQTSVAALAVTAHEVGHAVQDARSNLLFSLRSGIVPAVNFGSRLGPILFILGFFLRFGPLMWLGIVLFSLAFAFTVVTLPLELDASHKALAMLTDGGLLVGGDERRGARAVLNAAALTYVAALLTALAQLLYYAMLASGSRRRR
jgi:Zn-dependent membrane protease YugP